MRPRTDRRGAHERQCAIGEGDRPAIVRPEHAVTQLEELGARDRFVGQCCSSTSTSTPSRSAVRVPTHVRGGEVRKLGRRHHVERRAQRARLDDRPRIQRPGQLLLAKALAARPEGDVRRGRYCACSATSFVTTLRGESRFRSSSNCRRSSVRFSSRRRHGTTAALSRSRGGSANNAGSPASETRWVTRRSHG